MKFRVLVSLLAGAILLHETYSWSGPYVCKRSRYRRSYVRVCAYRTWRACCAWRNVWVTSYYIDSYCCTGWKYISNYYCNTPICNPGCYNGGTCIGPNRCTCRAGYSGNLCTTNLCSHERPCYPGVCIEPSQCTCETGFQGTGCITLRAEDSSPEITKCRVWLRKYKREVNMLMHELISDGTNQPTKDIVWTNQKDFNHITFELESLYEPPDDLPPRPQYVNRTELGIVAGSIDMLITKIPLGGVGERPIAIEKTFPCTNGASDDNPLTEVSNCTIIDDNFSILLENGHWMTLTYTTKNGGYNDLINTDTNRLYQKQLYKGVTVSKELEFRFDFRKPTHCYQDDSCDPASGLTPLSVPSDITKEAITPRWSGWEDSLSGVFRYACEIFKLEPDYKGDLATKRPLDPIEIVEVMHNDTILYPTFTPPGPGMYGIVLEVNDNANMSEYTRRLVIYDPLSTITVNNQADYRLFASTASRESDFLWQHSTGSVSVNFTWGNHFANLVHENGKLLNKVLPYPHVLDDGGTRGEGYKRIGANLDDTEGDRTLEAIPNAHGIVRFEFAEARDSHGGSTLNIPTTGWTDSTSGSSPLEWALISENVVDGDTVRVWVRAHDMMGNEAVDYADVHFDTSDPIVRKITLDRNNENGTYHFSSRVGLDTYDEHSGIRQINFSLIANGSDEVLYEGFALSTKNPNRTDCEANRPECYCTPFECFYYRQGFDIDHCWLIISKDKLATQVVNVVVNSVNFAGASTETQLTISDLLSLNGVDDYHGPKDFETERTGPYSVRVSWSWNEDQRCSDMRTEIILVLVVPGKDPLTIPIHRDATFYELTGLSPETAYSLKLITAYGTQNSDPVALKFKTEPLPSDINAGLVVGLVILFLLVIIVVIVIIMCCLWRRGMLKGKMGRAVERTNTVFSNARNRLTQRIPTDLPSVKHHRKSKANPYDNHGIDDDIYLYGEMEYETRPEWQLGREDVTFEELITSGKFANIYKASINRGRRDHQTVVAKTLKENATPEDILLMKAKINFTGSQVGNHPNLVKFLGAVLDDEGIGPFMILEYCENGALRDWLVRQRSNITEHLTDKLYQFSYDICKGMEFLASKGIVHRRLAARNILLNFLEDAKISGFGPKTNESEDDDQGSKERVPIKWMAPECMKSTKDADEKSDVWSYGIVLWEIFSLGDTPYPDFRSRDVAARVNKGAINDKPEMCDDQFYEIMTRCWKVKPQQRPDFSDVRTDLDPLFITQPGNDTYYYYQGKS